MLRGGRLNAIGTREQPIVFTSDQAIGDRNRGDWGGLIINGSAPVNLEGGQGQGEADTGVYGGDDPNDNSGTLRYVRVEFAGVEFSPDNELNGIAFQGVGRGGTFEFIQVHMNRDDALEWFGGTADIKYAVASNAADDSFDWTFGWTGRAQFIAIHQRGDDADNGIEADNNEFNNNLLPRSHPQIYNLTMCGDPDRNEGAESVRAANIRRGTAFTIRNFLVTGFKTTGFQIADANTLAQVDNGTSQLGAGVFWNIGTTPIHSSIAPYVNSGRFPERARRSGRRALAGVLRPQQPELPAGVGRDAGGRANVAHSAAQRRLLRTGHVHRCGAPCAGRGLDQGLDVVSTAVMASQMRGPVIGGLAFVLVTSLACGAPPLTNTHDSPESLVLDVLAAFVSRDHERLRDVGAVRGGVSPARLAGASGSPAGKKPSIQLRLGRPTAKERPPLASQSCHPRRARVSTAAHHIFWWLDRICRVPRSPRCCARGPGRYRRDARNPAVRFGSRNGGRVEGV